MAGRSIIALPSKILTKLEGALADRGQKSGRVVPGVFQFALIICINSTRKEAFYRTFIRFFVHFADFTVRFPLEISVDR